MVLFKQNLHCFPYLFCYISVRLFINLVIICHFISSDMGPKYIPLWRQKNIKTEKVSHNLSFTQLVAQLLQVYQTDM
jgi:hypothetical protein